MQNLEAFYKKWCKDTHRNGGVLVGSSIKELLTDIISSFKLEEITEEEKDEPKFVVRLKKAWGLKGYKTALALHPVFEYRDRYIIYLEPENPKLPQLAVPFYKSDLKEVINYLPNENFSPNTRKRTEF